MNATIRRVVVASALRGTIMLLALTAGAAAQATSLYDENSFRSLAADNKAHRAGDVITIQVFENSSATTNSDTTTRRKNGLAASLTHRDDNISHLGIDVSGEFDGGGRTQRAGKLLAQLTVSVREVLPNGDMRVAGEQRLVINDELQRINIEGRVRPQDISDGNVVLSTRLADAQITYLGDGDLSERQKRSWWRKTMDWLGF
jgi:flagellar L-ring protein precursor FlgH